MKNKIIYYNLYFFKAIIILLAFQQHYVNYINALYTSYIDYIPDLFVNKEWINKLITVSPIEHSLLNFFVFWVSHAYIFLACFNLGNHTDLELKRSIKRNFLFGLTLTSFFFIEGLIFGEGLGDKLSPNPLMIWGIIIMMISIIYHFFQKLGIILALILAYIFCYGMYETNLSNIIESKMQVLIHPAFSIDARLENFILSGFIGFIAGNTFLKYDLKKTFLIFSPYIVIPFFLSWNQLPLDINNMENSFHNEKIYYSNMNNQFIIHGILIFLIFSLLYLEKKKITINFVLFNYIGKNSLFLFILHKPLMLFVYIPLKTALHYYFNLPYEQNYLEVLSMSLATVFIGFLLQKYLFKQTLKN